MQDQVQPPDGDFAPNLVNTICWLVSFITQLATFGVNYVGEPFNSSITTNKGLWGVLRWGALFYVVLVLDLVPGLAGGIKLVRPALCCLQPAFTDMLIPAAGQPRAPAACRPHGCLTLCKRRSQSRCARTCCPGCLSNRPTVVHHAVPMLGSRLLARAQVSVPQPLCTHMLVLAAADGALCYAWEMLLRRLVPAPRPQRKGYMDVEQQLRLRGRGGPQRSAEQQRHKKLQ